MTLPTTPQSPDLSAPTTIDLVPFNAIRTETVFSKFPLHTLAKRGSVTIHIAQQTAAGTLNLYWHVSPHPVFGVPRQLAYKLDTLVINRRIDALGRPLPEVIYLGTLRDIARELQLGSDTAAVKRALRQNAHTVIAVQCTYTDTQGVGHEVAFESTRYGVILTGERLPDGRKADAVYIVLNPPYRHVLNTAPTRPLNYDYLKALTPAAQRWYELLSYQVFAALKYGHLHAKFLYSEYCTFSAQQRYSDYTHVKKQMYKVHKPHLTSTYLTSVHYERTTDADGSPDWCMYYVPGPKAHAEYAAFNPRSRRRTERPTAVLQAAAPEAVTRLDVESAVAPTPAVVAAPTADAQALVQYFYQRFHGTAAVVPASTKALALAQDLLTQYGVDQARHLVDFSVSAAKETKYQPQTLSGILHYLPQALADSKHAQQRRTADERALEERRRAQADEARRAQYEAYRAERVAQLRASLPPDELATVEADAAARFEREHTGQFGRESMRSMALDDAVAAHGEIPSFAAWQEDETHGGR